MATILSPGDYTVPPPPPPVLITKVVIAGLQMGSFTPIWGVGRSTPVANPPVHGSISQVPGSPAQYDFKPALVKDPSTGKFVSDNIYMLRQLLNQVDNNLLAAAKQFSNSFWLKIDNLNFCQAVEVDFPTPMTAGTMGLQFLPGPTFWQVRAFDFNKSTWVALPGVLIPASQLLTGVNLGGTYTCDGKTVTHTSVSVAGVTIPVNYSQACGPKRVQPLLNAAFQLDATTDAKEYKPSIDNFSISFQ
jgi:hypothetical protein